MNRKDVLGTLLQNNKYSIKITEDNTYTLDSTDNKNYDYVMNPQNFKRNHTYKTLHISLSGIKNMNIALICDFNTIEYDCAILEGDTLTILLNDYIAQGWTLEQIVPQDAGIGILIGVFSKEIPGT